MPSKSGRCRECGRPLSFCAPCRTIGEDHAIPISCRIVPQPLPPPSPSSPHDEPRRRIPAPYERLAVRRLWLRPPPSTPSCIRARRSHRADGKPGRLGVVVGLHANYPTADEFRPAPFHPVERGPRSVLIKQHVPSRRCVVDARRPRKLRHKENRPPDPLGAISDLDE